ncbi:MAG: hypothetical protein ACK57E_12580, partial [Erythrobacteraceae bacterium]
MTGCSTMWRKWLLIILGLSSLLLSGPAAALADDPLPSWQNGNAKSAIIDFVGAVTTKGSRYVPPAERIAVFGNSDGDKAMLEYVTIANPRPSLGVIIRHTDAAREYQYDVNPKS